jgi:manganese/zinc/iron transport system ATP- binding protein
VLAAVTLQAPPGAVVGLIGPNGSGKSTLLKAIAGVLPLRDGSVTLSGRSLTSYAGRVAFVPQREEVRWDFPVTALDVVLMGRYRRISWLRWARASDRSAAREALARLGLEGAGHRHISQFSGGQQQRIFLARAMVQEPVLVLLDEPFTGIDAANRAVFHEAIAAFSAQGIPVLMATHDLDEVSATCSHVIALNRGLVAAGPTSTTFTPEVLRQTFGGQIAVFA